MASQPSFCPSLRWDVGKARTDCKSSSSLNLGSEKLTWDTFSTIVIETESLVNAKPLTHVRSDVEDEDPLTPNHFLIESLFYCTSMSLQRESHRPDKNVDTGATKTRRILHTEYFNKKTISSSHLGSGFNVVI